MSFHSLVLGVVRFCLMLWHLQKLCWAASLLNPFSNRSTLPQSLHHALAFLETVLLNSSAFSVVAVLASCFGVPWSNAEVSLRLTRFLNIQHRYCLRVMLWHCLKQRRTVSLCSVEECSCSCGQADAVESSRCHLTCSGSTAAAGTDLNDLGSDTVTLEDFDGVDDILAVRSENIRLVFFSDSWTLSSSNLVQCWPCFDAKCVVFALVV